MKKLILFLVAGAAVLLIGWQVYAKLQTAKEKKPAATRGLATGPVAVETTLVRRGVIRDIGMFSGSLYPWSRFEVAPKIPGRLEKLSVNIGDIVQPNQLIAQLDDAEYKQQVEQARAERDVAQANVGDCQSARDLARSEFTKVDELKTKGIASTSDWEKAKASLDASAAKHKVALAQVEQKEAALRGAEVRLSYTQIHAAWQDGPGPRVVGERFVDAGAMLKANDPIVSVLELNRLLAVVHVIERDYPRVQVGQAALLWTDAFPDRSFPGKVVRIAPLLREASRQARMEIEVPNTDGTLKPGFFVRVQIEFARHDNTVLVPMSALVRSEGVQGVFVPEAKDSNGQKTVVARFVPVKVGITNGETAEVVEPTLNGTVITVGQHLVQPGAPILLEERGGRSRTPANTTTRPARVGNNPRTGGQR